MLEVLLVDDHPIVAMGLSLALRSHPKFSFRGGYVRLDQAFEAVSAGNPDLVVLDLVFASRADVGVIKQCKDRWPAAHVIVFSMLPAIDWSRRAIKAGASSYVEKTGDISDLLFELDRVAGEPSLQTTAGDREPRAFARSDAPARNVAILSVLTRREREIADLIADGRSTGEIANVLAISRNTVAVHQDNIRRKLACVSIKSLIAKLATIHADRH